MSHISRRRGVAEPRGSNGDLSAWRVSCFEFIDHILTSNNYRVRVDRCIGQTVAKLADSLNTLNRQFRVTEQPVSLDVIALVQYVVTGQKPRIIAFHRKSSNRAGLLRGNIPDLYSVGARFESRPGHSLSWGSSWFSSRPPDKRRDNTYIKPWPLPSESFPIHPSSYQPMRYNLDNESVG
jgi:hypothetical protein